MDILRSLFASHGLPLQIVSDNGPQFVSAEFAEFLERNGVKHVRCAPYHPASNGLAERFLRTFKEAMKAGNATAKSVHKKTSQFPSKISSDSSSNYWTYSCFIIS